MPAEFKELIDIALCLLVALGGGAVVAVSTILSLIVIAALSVWVSTRREAHE